MAAHAEVHAVLQVCGFANAAVRNLLIQNEGFETLEDIAVMEEDRDVSEMAKRGAQRTVGDGRVLLSTVQIKRLQGLVWWLHDRIKHHQPLDAAAFTAQVMATAMTKKTIEKQLVDSTVTVKDLGKFHPDDFDVQEDAFLNVLSQTLGVQKVTLRYVVRDQNPPANFVNDEQERMFQLELQGAAYEQDNIMVYHMLKSFLVESPGWPWIEPFDATENGREAFWAWANHYNGDGELSKRVQLAKAKIKSLHYKNERSMPFETYQTHLTKCILTLRKRAEDRLTPRQEVETLLEGFNSPDTELTAAKAVVRQSYPRNFADACAYLGALIATVHGSAQVENLRYRQRKRQVSAVYGRDGRGRGRGRARRGGRGGRDGGRNNRDGRGRGRGQGRVVINGIDVSDPTRSFTDEEWDALRPNGGLVYVHQQRERIHGRGPGQGRGRGQGGRNISSLETETHDTSENPRNDTNDRGGRNGGRFGRGAYGQGRGGRN